MRIGWSEESAGIVAAGLSQLWEQMATCLDRSGEALSALEAANPGGDNKRLNAIGEALETCLTMLKRAREDSEALMHGTRTMIDTFEEVERDALRLLNSLNEGRAMEPEARAMRAAASEAAAGHTRPHPVLAPHAAVGSLGPVPGWLNAKLDQHRNAQYEGGAPWQSLK